MARLIIITGASRGLGFELAKQSLRDGNTVVTLERKPSNELHSLSEKSACELIQLTVDLRNLNVAISSLSYILRQADPSQFERVDFINNAGILGPVGALTDAEAAEIDETICINYEAPVLLTQAFLTLTESWSVEKRILNISSGAARKDVIGWAMYCSSKAALDRFSSCLAAEARAYGFNLRIEAVAPGVVDTDMQATIRSSDPAVFPELNRFIDLNNKKQLTSAEHAASLLLKHMDSDAFGQNPISDIRTITVEG